MITGKGRRIVMHILTDALEIHFIDMKKFNALPDKDIKNNWS